MITQRRLVIGAAALCVSSTAALASIGSATAQTWPTRTVKFIVSLGPGSGADNGPDRRFVKAS
jgi:tripartite-type tricarboxylate transporter receptor subunit TctC